MSMCRIRRIYTEPTVFRAVGSTRRLLVLVAVLGCVLAARGAAQELWCPMHPNIRADTGTCRQCGMALVPIPDNSDASYWLDVSAEPAAAVPGKPITLSIGVRDRATDALVSQFDEMHERWLHLFIVATDLTFFDHVHPDPERDGSSRLQSRFQSRAPTASSPTSCRLARCRKRCSTRS